MKCVYCGRDFSGDVCPGCGAPGESGQKEEKKPPVRPAPAKPMSKASCLLRLLSLGFGIAAIAFAFRSCSRVMDTADVLTDGLKIEAVQTDSPSTMAVTLVSATPEVTADLSGVETLYTLATGNYVAGVDIPVGKCDVTAVEGRGNLYSSNMFQGGINEVFGTEDGSGTYADSFSGLELPSGATLCVGGALSVRLEFTAIEAGYTGRTYDENSAVTLETGNYVSGTDFEAGVYKITAVTGRGNLYSSNLYDGGVNEVFGVNDGSGTVVSEVLGISLPEGTELTVSGGLTILLIPAAAN